jgi:Kelch motif/Putative Ig domain
MRLHFLRRSRAHLLFQLVVLSCFFFPPLELKALPPEIVLPSDPDFTGVNEAFDGTAWGLPPPLALMPTPRIDFAISRLNGKIYAAGGRAFTITGPITTVEAYDPGTDSWEAKAPLPIARFNTGAGTIADGMPQARMYVVGGLRSNLTITGRVDVYNSVSNTWTTKTAMSFPRWGVSCAVTGGLLYAIGGVESTGVVGRLEAYAPATNMWTTLASISVARRNAVVGVVGGKIYAIGGVNDDIDPNTGLTDVEVYDPGTDMWTTLMSMPKPQLAAAGGVIAGKIYVTGGIEGDVTQTALSVVQVYDPVTDSWDEVAPMPTARLNHRAAVVDNVLYAIGGRFFGVARIDQPFLYQIVATNNPTSYDASPLPPGLSIDTARGLIYGTPTGTPSETTVTLSASNTDGAATQDINFKVLPAIPSALFPADAEPSPAIISSKSVTGRLDAAFSFQVLVKNATESTTLDAAGLPPGLTLDPVTGLISGTVLSSVDDGDGLVTNQVTLTLDKGLPTQSQDDLEMVFTSDAATPVITGLEVVTLVPNQVFTYVITADADAIFHYRTADGVLDGDFLGLSFNGVNTISGTYTPGGLFDLARKVHPSSVRADYFRGLGKFSAPDTLKIRPPCIETVVLMGDSISAARSGFRPLNFFEPTAVSLLSHGTSGDVFAISLPLEGDPGAPGVECRNGNTGKRYQIVVTFPTPITWDFHNITIEGSASLDGQPTISDDTEVTVNLKNATDQQVVTIQLSDVGVDPDANGLPTWSYDVRVPLGLLIADKTGNGVVEADDKPRASDFGETTSTNFRYDFNRDGVVNNADARLARMFAGHHLP